VRADVRLSAPTVDHEQGRIGSLRPDREQDRGANLASGLMRAQPLGDPFHGRIVVKLS